MRFLKGKQGIGIGFDNVNKDNGLYWDVLGCNWAALGSTGLAWTVVDCTGMNGAVIDYRTVLEYTELYWSVQ